MKIAVIGAGVSGLVVANKLSGRHEVQVYEKASSVGGHTATVDVEYGGEKHAIDTGFIVYNERTYPKFIALLDHLNVKTQLTTMGFSVSTANAALEYAGGSISTLFAQKKNLLSPSFHKMWMDIIKFNARAKQDWANGSIHPNLSLGAYLETENYGVFFHRYYLLPMGAAIWSCSIAAMYDFPAQFFVRFFFNHGLLDIRNRPAWRVLKGGSRAYIEPLIEPFKDAIQLNADIQLVERQSDQVKIVEACGRETFFDEVVFATHSDQALTLLADASDAEHQVLSAIPYKDNHVILHTDECVLPKARSTWSSWNYFIEDEHLAPILSYNMNILQGLHSNHTFCVTLNDTKRIDPEKIIQTFTYAHPQFSIEAERAQERWKEINGQNKTWYCGAYWANGFHEDGVVSALRVVEAIDQGQNNKLGHD